LTLLQLVPLRQRVAILVTVSELLGGHDVVEGGDVFRNTVDAARNAASKSPRHSQDGRK
jgi:hypothetical protein